MADHSQQQAAKWRKVYGLFDTWDNDSSGFLELEELQLVLCKWKDFSAEKAAEQGSNAVKPPNKGHIGIGAVLFFLLNCS